MSTPVALVTGAGAGIGKAVAEELAERGYELVLMTRSDGAEKVAGKLGGVALRGSVTETADLERMVQTALDRFGRIDAVLNNTGQAPNTGVPATGSRFDPDADLRLLELTDAEWETAFEMIFLSVVRMTRLVAPIMARQGGGAIVNITSFAQLEPSYAFPTGSAMRMALAGYSKLFSDSWGRQNVRMNNLLPAFMENYPLEDRARDQIPLGRSGLMSELAKTVAFLMGPDAGYITGQSLLLDGGMNRSV